ncbi:hypothetical protein VTI74DRAFT_406 [Chaetomium olivicolor]
MKSSREPLSGCYSGFTSCHLHLATEMSNPRSPTRSHEASTSRVRSGWRPSPCRSLLSQSLASVALSKSGNALYWTLFARSTCCSGPTGKPPRPAASCQSGKKASHRSCSALTKIGILSVL